MCKGFKTCKHMYMKCSSEFCMPNKLLKNKCQKLTFPPKQSISFCLLLLFCLFINYLINIKIILLHWVLRFFGGWVACIFVEVTKFYKLPFVVCLQLFWVQLNLLYNINLLRKLKKQFDYFGSLITKQMFSFAFILVWLDKFIFYYWIHFYCFMSGFLLHFFKKIKMIGYKNDIIQMSILQTLACFCTASIRGSLLL